MILQIIRRLVQLSVVALVAAIAFLSLYAHYRAARVIDDPDLMKGLRGEVAARVIHPYVEKLDDPQSFLDDNKGTVWSMRLFGVSLTDPLAAAEAIAASKHVHWPLVVSIMIPVLLTLLLGKVFCSWICPGYLLFELTGKLRRVLRFAEIQPGEVKFSFANKYVFLCVGLLIAAAASAPLFALIYPPAVISRVIHGWIFGTAVTGMLVLLGVLVAVELFVSPRWWCRTMCPGGALYGLIGRFRPLHVKLATEHCTGCQACIDVCEAGINPITHSQSIECDNCGVCIRHCGDGALKYALSWPVLGKGSSEFRVSDSESCTSRAGVQSPVERQPRTHETEELVPTASSGAGDGDRRLQSLGCLLGVLLPFLGVSEAAAHHILGLPHYSYKENYPQRPTLEYPAETGPYDVLLTSYPGVPVPGEQANLAFYIRNRETGVPFGDSVSVRILKTSTFGDNEVLMPPTRRKPFDNEHKFHFMFPTDGEYVVELSLRVEGKTEVIPFLMVAGEPTATASIVVAGSVGAVICLVGVRAVQRKRRRRAAMASGQEKDRVRTADAQPVPGVA